MRGTLRGLKSKREAVPYVLISWGAAVARILAWRSAGAAEWGSLLRLRPLRARDHFLFRRGGL